MQSQAKSESISKYIPIAEKIRDYISCKYCQKHCYVYSNKFLTDNEQYDYQQALKSFSYSCGALIFPDEHYLKEEGKFSICYYCRNSDDLITPSQSLKESFKQIYPLCEVCEE
ncbi:27589_t:CDS:2, partial [Dentiscutata erythropus]